MDEEALLEKTNETEGGATWSQWRHFATVSHALRRSFELVRPSLFTRNARAHKLRKTSYLDGLRGFAAFLVFWMHSSFYAHAFQGAIKIFENAYGFEDQYYFGCLPIIRTFFSGGHLAVTVFFVISGYVLCAKPLSLIQAGEPVGLRDNLASALFRRWMRLYIPVAGTTFVYMTVWHAFGVYPEIPDHKETYLQELRGWFLDFKEFSFIFEHQLLPWMVYNVHTWSIPKEFRGSIVVFTATLALSRCNRNKRLLGQFVLFLYFFVFIDAWYCALFMAGMMLSDFDLLAENNNLPFPTLFSKLQKRKQPIFICTFLIAILMGGVPTHTTELADVRRNPGWYLPSFLIPSVMYDPKYGILVYAAPLLVLSISHLPWLRSFFETSFIQYLGRISFSLYLVHGPVLWLLGTRLYAATGMVNEWHTNNIPGWVDVFHLPDVGPLGLKLAFLVPQLLVIMPVTFWVAEISTRLFDESSVRFTQWFYEKALS